MNGKRLLFWITGCSVSLIGFLLLIVIAVVVIASSSQRISNTGNYTFDLSEKVLMYKTEVDKELARNNIDVKYSNYILSMIEVLTKGEGTDIMQVNRFVPVSNAVANPIQSIEIGIGYFANLLAKVNLPFMLDGADPDQNELKKLMQAYVLGVEFIEYLGSRTYSLAELETYLSENTVDEDIQYFAEDVYITKITNVDKKERKVSKMQNTELKIRGLSRTTIIKIDELAYKKGISRNEYLKSYIEKISIISEITEQENKYIKLVELMGQVIKENTKELIELRKAVENEE